MNAGPLPPALTGPGHNGGPPLEEPDPNASWRLWCWRRARGASKMAKSQREMAGAMISKAQFKNFRGFRDLTLDGFRRLNLIVGNNGSGKTALMEGLYLGAAASPQIALGLRQFRGFPPPQGPMALPSLSALWEDLFRNFEIAPGVQIDISGNESNNGSFDRSLRIYSAQNDSITVPFPTPAEPQLPSTPNTAFKNISFEWRWRRNGEAEAKAVITPQMTPAGLLMGQAAGGIVGGILPARWGFSADLAAENFTGLVKKGQKAKFISAMTTLFPDVLEIDAGHEQGHGLLLVRLKNFDRPIPAFLFSDGFGRISEILLLIAQLSGGFVLVDEIENGLYFERYANVLQAIDQFSEEFGAQIFCTTHSDAILDAFHEHVANKTNDFSIIRCFRAEDGGTSARIISGDRAEQALRSGIELRV